MLNPQERWTIEDCLEHPAFKTERLLNRNFAPVKKYKKHSRIREKDENNYSVVRSKRTESLRKDSTENSTESSEEKSCSRTSPLSPRNTNEYIITKTDSHLDLENRTDSGDDTQSIAPQQQETEDNYVSSFIIERSCKNEDQTETFDLSSSDLTQKKDDSEQSSKILQQDFVDNDTSSFVQSQNKVTLPNNNAKSTYTVSFLATSQSSITNRPDDHHSGVHTTKGNSVDKKLPVKVNSLYECLFAWFNKLFLLLFFLYS